MNASQVPALPWSPAWLVRYGNFLFKTRDAVFPVVLVGLLVMTPMGTMGGDVPRSRLVDIAGVAIALAGQLLRVAVIGYRYIVRGGRNREVYAEGLVSTGFFALSRNPLYVGNILILAGLFVIWNSPWMYLFGAPFFLLGYRAIVAAEEAYLGRQYGSEFAAYCARVPRWWVRLGGLATATSGMTFNWRRVVLKEYGSAAYWMAGSAVLLLLKDRRYALLTSTEPRPLVYWVAIGGVVLGWGIARYLKKSKRLKE
ncbi:MAG: isoprenylcysteine carboxylmethyltransferase family protein [Gemmatimonadetes bacterium]|nr:isoprenylcysteine carboxylmethyltransferase family protein [Gemmatimonadota bacterium]